MYTSHTKTTPWTTELSNTTENSHPNTSPVLNRCSRTLTLTTISKSAPCHAIRRYLSWKNSLLMRKHSGNLWNRPFARHVRNLSRQGYWKAEILRKTLSENWTALKKKYYVEARSPEVVNAYRTKLEAKVSELLEDTQIDDNRIAAEVILFSDKICNDEETVRLHSHIRNMKKMLTTEKEGIGRKLDFMAQEMNREANTILSKSSDLEISNIAIDLKTEIEKVREQIQNVE